MGAADLISRKGVSAWLANMGHPKLAEIVMDEKRFPPAGAKRGKWVDDGDPLMLTCGNCGYGVMRYNNTPFCPNCGANMEVNNESN